jgi:purine-nucleoside/S-methyl-5'-thioadenosine phosphorylase / adenosine deaminase
MSQGLITGLNLGFCRGDGWETVERNRRAFLKALGARHFQLATVKQVHSALGYVVSRTWQDTLEYHPGGYALPAGSQPAEHHGDALLTDQPLILLSVRVADCLPLLVADMRRRVIAAIHAGWRGMLGRIVEKSLGDMWRIYGCRPKDLRVALGPSIRACCYPVGEEVLDAFRSQFVGGEGFFRWAADKDPSAKLRERFPLLFLSQAPPGHGPDFSRAPHLDLIAAARHQLAAAGLTSRQIFVSPHCTACDTRFFYSHRAEGPRAGRMMAVIGILPESRKTSRTLTNPKASRRRLPPLRLPS